MIKKFDVVLSQASPIGTTKAWIFRTTSGKAHSAGTGELSGSGSRLVYVIAAKGHFNPGCSGPIGSSGNNCTTTGLTVTFSSTGSVDVVDYSPWISYVGIGKGYAVSVAPSN
jgi:hypothetical protein